MTLWLQRYLETPKGFLTPWLGATAASKELQLLTPDVSFINLRKTNCEKHNYLKEKVAPKLPRLFHIFFFVFTQSSKYKPWLRQPFSSTTEERTLAFSDFHLFLIVNNSSSGCWTSVHLLYNPDISSKGKINSKILRFWALLISISSGEKRKRAPVVQNNMEEKNIHKQPRFSPLVQNN